MARLASVAALPLGIDVHRVHLVDSYPRNGSPQNFLVRGNNPVDKGGSFNITALRAAIAHALGVCNVTIPHASFKIHTLDLENPADPGYFKEHAYWREHSDEGILDNWMTLGSLLQPQHASNRTARVERGDWAIGGHADHLPQRLNATRQLLTNLSNPWPTVIYVHCNAGCDRTGEFIGSYAMTYLGYNVTTMYGEACRQCGRCPNYYATSALGWWCLTLAARGWPVQGSCLNFAGCKFLGDCDAHSPTPLADACPS